MGAPVGRGTIAVGLDVGTTKICAIVGREEEGRIEITAVGSSPSSGLRKGMVVDMDLAVSSIQRAIKDVSDKAGWTVRSAYVGIAGGHIKGFNGRGAIVIKGGVVNEGDVEMVIDSAGAAYVPVERDILHVIPAGYRIDGRNGINDPIGMSGERLEANVHIVTGSVAAVENLVTCCKRAGVDVIDIVLEPLASAESVLGNTEKRKGSVLIDIGGGTTDIAFYRDGILRHTSVLSIGGNHITNDIAVGLGISVEEAERIKKEYGFRFEGVTDGDALVIEVVESADDKERKREIPCRHLAEIVRARCEELLMLVKKEMEDVSCNLARSTIVLTGGTSLLRGLRELAEGMFGTPVRIGVPRGIADGGLVQSPIYATGVGLVRYGLSSRVGPELESEGVIVRMRKWVIGFFE